MRYVDKNIQAQKVQNSREKLQTLNDFQKWMGDI